MKQQKSKLKSNKYLKQNHDFENLVAVRTLELQTQQWKKFVN